MPGILQSKNLSHPIHTGDIKYLSNNFLPRLSELLNLNYTTLLKKYERIFQTLDQTTTLEKMVEHVLLKEYDTQYYTHFYSSTKILCSSLHSLNVYDDK